MPGDKKNSFFPLLFITPPDPFPKQMFCHFPFGDFWLSSKIYVEPLKLSDNSSLLQYIFFGPTYDPVTAKTCDILLILWMFMIDKMINMERITAERTVNGRLVIKVNLLIILILYHLKTKSSCIYVAGVINGLSLQWQVPFMGSCY